MSIIHPWLIFTIKTLCFGLRQHHEYKFSLRFCDRNYKCHYTSAIAHQFSSKIHKSPLEIAQIIFSELPVTSPVNSKLSIAIEIRQALEQFIDAS
jgi:hypothetical protein